MARDDPQQLEMLAKRIPKAVAACDCQLDVDGLEAVLVAIAAPTNEHFRAVSLPASLETTGTVDELARKLKP